MKNERKRKSASEQRGRFKLVVFFKDHRLSGGFTMYSKVGQDRRGVSLERFKSLVLQGKWAGKVKWAGVYENGLPCWEIAMSDK